MSWVRIQILQRKPEVGDILHGPRENRFRVLRDVSDFKVECENMRHGGKDVLSWPLCTPENGWSVELSSPLAGDPPDGETKVR